MRAYINTPVHIDGRYIPYPVFTSSEYFTLHDHVDDVDSFIENHPELDELVNQIMALKQSCFLLRHTSHSCQSLSDNLYRLKGRLIKELKEKYNYEFDDPWVEKLIPID